MQRVLILLIVGLNVGLIALLAIQIRDEKVSFLALRSEDGFLFLETLTHHVEFTLEGIERQRDHMQAALNAAAEQLISMSDPLQAWDGTAPNRTLVSGSFILDETCRLVAQRGTACDACDWRVFTDVCAGHQAFKAVSLRGPLAADVAIAWHLDGGGALVLTALQDAASPVLTDDFNRLMQYDDLDYLVFESFDVVYFAAPPDSAADGVLSMRDDPDVVQAIYSDEPFAREVDAIGEAVLECVWPVYVENVFFAVIRAGLSLDFVRHLETDFVKRVGAAGVLIVLLDALFAYSLYLARRVGRDGVKFRSVLEGIGDGVAIFEERKPVFGNDKMRTLLGDDWPNAVQTIDGPLNKIDRDGRTLLVLKNETAFGPIIIVRDISMEEFAQKAKEREKRMFSMGKLAGVVAHEIRNPLNSISMIMQQLHFSSTKQRDMLDLVHAEIQRLNGVVAEFIEMTKIPMMAKTFVPIITFFEELSSLYTEPHANQGIVWDIAPDIGSEEVLMDRDKMKGVIINLAQNSIHAGATQIRVTVRQTDRFTVIAVSDNGSGMDHTTLEKAFDLYFTTKPSGSGLGLAQVHRVISAHGGFVNAESTPGQGTTIEIYLPRERDVAYD